MGYVCTNGTNTTVSVCEVSLTPEFTVLAFEKDPSANAATISLSLSTLPPAASSNISAYLSLNFPTESVRYSVDSLTNEVTIHFTYG